jgi:hypothetical protein
MFEKVAPEWLFRSNGNRFQQSMTVDKFLSLALALRWLQASMEKSADEDDEKISFPRSVGAGKAVEKREKRSSTAR